MGIFPSKKDAQLKPVGYATSDESEGEEAQELKNTFAARWNPKAIKLINDLINTLVHCTVLWLLSYDHVALA